MAIRSTPDLQKRAPSTGIFPQLRMVNGRAAGDSVKKKLTIVP
jgi:hypothetical protein